MAALLSFCSAIPQHTEKHFPFTLTLQVLPENKYNQIRDKPCSSNHYSLTEKHLTEHSMVCKEQHHFSNTPLV